MPQIDQYAWRVAVVPNKGTRIFFENLVESLTVEELEGELAQRVNLSLKNEKVGKKRMAQYLANGSEIRYYSGYDRPLEERFRGRTFRNRSSWSDGPRHEITSYDPLFYIANSEDDRFYPEGKTGKQIIADIARAWGIPVKKLRGPDEKLSRKAFLGKPLAEMFSAVLSESRKRGGGRWLVRMDAGKLETVRRASNKRPWVFEAEDIAELEVDRSIESLVTVAEIVGREKKGKASKTLGRAEGLTKYGRLQRIVNRSDYNSPGATRKAAVQLIKDEGREIRIRTFVAPDVPACRRGDKIIVRARTMNDTYIVRSVTHDPQARTMFVDAIDPDELEVHVDFDEMGLATWEPPEDEPAGGNGHSAGGGSQSKGGWQWPVGGPITSGYGPRGNDFHYGIDIGASTGTPVAPGKPGRVALAGSLSGYGNVIYIEHGGGQSSRYAHLSRMDVRPGAQVGYQTRIGAVGATGNATGPHLHFEIRVGGSAVNPMSMLP